MKFLGSRPTHKNINLVKADDPTVHTQNTDQYLDYGGANQVAVGDVKDAVAKKHEHANKTELDTYSATTQNLEYWVDGTNGSDDNDGSSGSPFKTIAKAVSLIPRIVNHNVTINLADGYYSEGITLSGYMGGGEIYILGNGDHPENVVIAEGIYAVRCSVGYIELYGMETTNTDSDGIYLADCSSYFTINHVLCDITDADYDGVYAIGCQTIHIKSSTFSNRWTGISAIYGTTVISDNNDGVNNDVGLYAEAATIMKYGIQPGGTTDEVTDNGGVIR